MRIPTQEQFDTVINNFEKIISKYPNAEVNMMEGRINHCGTPMCHSGWYALASFDKIGDDFNFNDGATKMAHDLGFNSQNELSCWAHSNPKIWGNECGVGLFCTSTAFTGEGGKTVKKLSRIIKHWKDVKKRANGK